MIPFESCFCLKLLSLIEWNFQHMVLHIKFMKVINLFVLRNIYLCYVKMTLCRQRFSIRIISGCFKSETLKDLVRQNEDWTMDKPY